MKRFFKELLILLWTFVIFFAMIAFVVTCSILLFFSGVALEEAEVRRIAPIVFGNVILLSLLFMTVDIIRRKLTVDRPAAAIQKTLDLMMQGDFSARVKLSDATMSGSRFTQIAERVNRLGLELEGVETLRSDFIANVSHEMKTPLAAIGNYGRLLQSPDLSEEERMEYAEGVCLSSARLSEMVTNILKLNRLENQQIYPDVKLCDLGEQIALCLLQFEPIWEEKNIDVAVDFEENVTAEADTELLSLVWSNLFSNAFKFTDAGGRVSVSLRTEGSDAVITVSDTGCGMSSEVGAHIFEKFYQGDSSHATHGNGLGLALVKRVMDILEGEITVESRPLEGSRFTVRIMRFAGNKHEKI